VRAGSHGTHIIAYRPKPSFRWRCRVCVSGLEQTARRCLDVCKHMCRKCRTCRANCRFWQNCSKSARKHAHTICAVLTAQNHFRASCKSAFCQNLGCYLRGAHRAYRTSGNFLKSGPENVPNVSLDKICGVHRIYRQNIPRRARSRPSKSRPKP
jgi:hypothetical protein